MLHRNALLYQAKKTTKQTVPMCANDDQRNLYVRWPRFTYDSETGLRGQCRQVTPPRAHAGAQYMFIDSPKPPAAMALVGPTIAHAVGSAMASRSMTHDPIEGELVKFLGLTTGRQFCSHTATLAAGCTGWSRVVWDLIRCTANRHFNLKSSGLTKTAAGAPPFRSGTWPATTPLRTSWRWATEGTVLTLMTTGTGTTKGQSQS